MARKVRSAPAAEPNMTPILDMVFQLITFFMLVINFKSAELDLTLNLPVVGSARPIETKGKKLLVINIKNVNGQANISLFGKLIPEERIKSYIAGEAQACMLRDHVTKEEIDSGEKELSDQVVIRADDKTPFGNVNLVITSCQEHGFRSFALKAMGKAEPKK